MGFFSDLWGWIKSAFKYVWDHIGTIIAILAIVLIVFAPVLLPIFAGFVWPVGTGWMGSLIVAAEGWGWIISTVVGLSIAGIADPDFTSGLVEDITDLASDVATSAGEVIGSFVGSTVSSLFGVDLSTILWATIGGYFGYKLLTSDGGSSSGSDGFASFSDQEESDIEGGEYDAYSEYLDGAIDTQYAITAEDPMSKFVF